MPFSLILNIAFKELIYCHLIFKKKWTKRILIQNPKREIWKVTGDGGCVLRVIRILGPVRFWI